MSVAREGHPRAPPDAHYTRRSHVLLLPRRRLTRRAAPGADQRAPAVSPRARGAAALRHPRRWSLAPVGGRALRRVRRQLRARGLERVGVAASCWCSTSGTPTWATTKLPCSPVSIGTRAANWTATRKYWARNDACRSEAARARPAKSARSARARQPAHPRAALHAGAISSAPVSTRSASPICRRATRWYPVRRKTVPPAPNLGAVGSARAHAREARSRHRAARVPPAAAAFSARDIAHHVIQRYEGLVDTLRPLRRQRASRLLGVAHSQIGPRCTTASSMYARRRARRRPCRKAGRRAKPSASTSKGARTWSYSTTSSRQALARAWRLFASSPRCGRRTATTTGGSARSSATASTVRCSIPIAEELSERVPKLHRPASPADAGLGLQVRRDPACALATRRLRGRQRELLDHAWRAREPRPAASRWPLALRRGSAEGLGLCHLQPRRAKDQRAPRQAPRETEAHPLPMQPRRDLRLRSVPHDPGSSRFGSRLREPAYQRHRSSSATAWIGVGSVPFCSASD